MRSQRAKGDLRRGKILTKERIVEENFEIISRELIRLRKLFSEMDSAGMAGIILNLESKLNALKKLRENIENHNSGHNRKGKKRNIERRQINRINSIRDYVRALDKRFSCITDFDELINALNSLNEQLFPPNATPENSTQKSNSRRV